MKTAAKGDASVSSGNRLIFLFILFLLSSAAHAQKDTGAIDGTVKDDEGGLSKDLPLYYIRHV
jgi:hypothetical protein